MTFKNLQAASIETPMGTMIAIADEKALYALEFMQCRDLTSEMSRLNQKINAAIVPGMTQPICSIENELEQYFANRLREFKTPIHWGGSPFQQRVWKALKKIPMGETRSYSDIALAIGQPQAKRAVGRANGSNPLSVIVPCHRVINKDGSLGGYAGGVERKDWLLRHEMKQPTL